MASEAETFLKTLFLPEDLILFRPIETWAEGGKKRSKVDSEGIRYERFGGRCGEGWAWHDSRLTATVGNIIGRTGETLANLFFGVCPRVGGGQQYDLAWQIRTVRALWSDIDDANHVEALDRCKANKVPEPSVVVASGNGVHLYWLLDHPALIDDADPPPPVHTEWCGPDGQRKRTLYLIDKQSGERLSLDAKQNIPPLSHKATKLQDALAGIAEKIGGDHTIDLSRILRLPGTLNRKDERNGRAVTECRLLQCDNTRRYPLEDLICFATQAPSRVKRDKVAQVPLPRRRVISTKLQERLDTAIVGSAAAETGRRSEADFALCCLAVELGLTPEAAWQHVSSVGKFAESGRRYFDRTWESACGHVREGIYTRVTAKHAADPPSSNGDGLEAADETNQHEAGDDPHRLARVYLNQNPAAVRYWREDFWEWTGKFYRRISGGNMRCRLTNICKQEFDRLAGDGKPGKVTRHLIGDVAAALESMTVLEDWIQAPAWLDGSGRKNCTALENGILDLDALLAGKDDFLLNHTPAWFSPVCLPYQFDPAADCLTWKRVLATNMEGDTERIALLQEWAGYILVPSTDMQQFLICEGEGANGKSVFCAGLEALVGRDNTAHVPLEVFADRFSLHQTLGKLLNVAAECGELDKVAEGYLKAFVAGDRMTLDRKHKDPIDVSPTARLVLAANNRPRFSDRSMGIWRRVIACPFLRQVPESERIVGADKPDFWEASGELPGMLNWAIAGLHRLRQQGRFTRPAACEKALADYRLEVNPARAFLTEVCEYDGTTELGTGYLYEAYSKWCRKCGYHPLGERVFGREVFRAHPKAKKIRPGTTNRTYFFVGIKVQDEF
jgi:P4 family phage/plasmid primase-like protien